MVWLSTANRTDRVASSAEFLAVHLLERRQYALAGHFGGRTGDEADKFADAARREGPLGAVLLDAVPVWFVGRVASRIEGGDHADFLLAPAQAAAGPAHWQPFRLSDAVDIDTGHPAQGA